MKQKRKMKTGHHALKTGNRKLKTRTSPPPIPAHSKMGFTDMGLYGESGSAHFAATGDDKEGDILLRQVEKRGVAYTNKKLAVDLLFSLVCGAVAGAVAYAVASFLGVGGIAPYAIAGIVFIVAAVIAFGSRGSC